MKRLLIIPFLCVSLILSATNYYVKNGGNDGAAGTSDGTAWETITKVRTSVFASGDSVLFKRGGTWVIAAATPLNTDYNNVHFGAYGTGANPIFSGFTTVTGWTDEGNGVYSKVVTTEAQDANEKVYIVTVDGVNTSMGRWPNTGWRTYESSSWGTSITDNQLDADTNWTGAEVVIRKHGTGWMLDRNVITNHVTTTLTYTRGSNWGEVNGFGYFIQNDLRTLDSFGEWFYNGTTLYMYFGAEATGDHVVKMSVVNKAINSDANTGQTFSSIHMTGFNRYGVYCQGATIGVYNCTFDFMAQYGVYNFIYTSGSKITIDDCTFSDIAGNAIQTHGTASDIVITDNIISRIGLLLGGATLAATDYWGDGISDIQPGSIIQYNRIDSVGHNGIAVRYGDNQNVSYNFINYFGLSRYDAGGIYTWDDAANNTARTISYNIVLNSNQTNSGMAGSANLNLWGIYLDEYAKNTTVSYNTVYNCETGGLFNLNAGVNTFSNNTAYDNGVYQFGMAHAFAYGEDVDSMTVMGNILFCRDETELSFYYRDDDGHFLTSANTYNNNYYARPINQGTDANTIQTYDSPTATDYSLATWKTYSSQDGSSNINLGGAVTTTDDLHFIYNDTLVNKTFTLSAGMKDVANADYSGSIYLEPFTSLILIGAGTVTAGFPTDPEEIGYPTVTCFGGLPYIASNAITYGSGGNVTDDGGGTITARGICWSTSVNPTTSDAHTVQSGTTGVFYSVLTGLRGGTTYHVRAYATNESGTAYSADTGFTTVEYTWGLINGKIPVINGKIGVVK